MRTIYSVYDQIADLLARIEPEKIKSLRASSELQERFNMLAEKHKNATISPIEKDELDHFLILERLFRLVKIRTEA